MSFDDFLGQLSRHLFWDTDPGAIRAGEHDAFLIARVMDRGTLTDVKLAWTFYGPDAIRGALIAAPCLDAKTIAFFANQFDLPRDAFRSYRPSPSPWNP